VLDNPLAVAKLLTREVRTGERDGEPTRIVIGRRTYGTDRDDLWNAVTDPERIPRWFLPVSGDLSEGGRYQLEGNAGGVIERCDRPRSFAVTWEMGPMTSWLTVTLEPTDGGTTLELQHEAPVDPDMWDQFGPGAVGLGWDLGLMALGLHLESGAAVDPEAGLAFPMTDEGRRFLEHAGADWERAAVADGDDAAAANEAAARTFAFYTTMPDDTGGSHETTESGD